ncbi:MAG: DNA polymerase III subunit alpha [Parvularculaceae bacterium]|nr:DNA polymerase III subunit alpha [Parvularculaceae bacterium]
MAAGAPPFIHLRSHSAYSLLEGAIPLGKLIGLATRNDMPALGLTDRNNLFGALEFSEKAAGAGLQPLIGVTVSMAPLHPAAAQRPGDRLPSIVLLAKDEAGYGNLLRLVSHAHLSSDGTGAPCLSYDTLETSSGGLIALSGGLDGPIDAALALGDESTAKDLTDRLAGIFGDRFYIELQRHGLEVQKRVEPALLHIAYGKGLPIVATNQPYFAAAEDHEAHDALIAIAEGKAVADPDRRQLSPEHWFKPGEVMTKLFADLPEAIENTVEIARRSAYRPLSRAPILPRFLGEGDGDELSELRRQAEDGLAQRLAAHGLAPGMDEAGYSERLAFEIDVIGRMQYPGYFLIVSDFIKWAKKEGIPVGPGRGSGAGSLVAWSLTITDLDPLRFGLLFERFLNPERVSMPDFDVDFCQDRRDEVIQYVQRKYGDDRVAQIITFGKLQARAVLRDVGRVIGMPFGQVDRLCKLVPNNPANPVTLAEAIETEPKLREERDREESVAALLEKALKLEGLYRHASTHAAGVVIGDRPLDELTPLYRDPRSSMPATQYNMKWVEPAGLVKFDFLGLKTLTVIAKAVQFVRQLDPEFSIDEMALDDRKSFQMMGEGATVGVFQLESVGMRSTLRAMKPDCLEDIIALVSLYRPGPMENIPTYIERKQGLQEPDYLHPSLQSVLEETYGVIIYQEQVMQIAQILSGYSLGEADLLRRAMGKKQKEEMDRQRKRFVDGAKANNVDPRKASSIFDLVQKFAGYGFNKSHAAAYAYIAYQTAFLKANFTAEFLAASMSLDIANTDKLAVFLSEARRNNVSVKSPHINASVADFSVVDGEIRYALGAIKNVGNAAMDEIARERKKHGPFEDMFNFAERVDLKAIGKRSLENLARAGAFDGLGCNRAQAVEAMDILAKYSAQVFSDRCSDQGGLFDMASSPSLERPRLPKVDEWPPMDLLNMERAALGFYFSGHPLDDYAKELRRLKCTSFAEAEDVAKNGTKFSGQIAVVVGSVRMRRSRAGNPFAFVECSDATGDFEIVVFSEVLGRSRDMFEAGAMLLLTATAEERDGEVRFACEGVRRLDTAAAETTSQMRVSIANAGALQTVRQRLSAVKPADRTEAGEVVVCLALGAATGREVDILLPGKVACTPAMRGALKMIDGVLDVELV